MWKLWHKLRESQNGAIFRQAASGGPLRRLISYVPQLNLVVEIDGGQHFERDGIEARSAARCVVGGARRSCLRFWQFGHR